MLLEDKGNRSSRWHSLSKHNCNQSQGVEYKSLVHGFYSACRANAYVYDNNCMNIIYCILLYHSFLFPNAYCFTYIHTQLQKLGDVKYPPTCYCPILYYRLIIPEWLKNYSTYYNSGYYVSTNKRQMVFSARNTNFPRFVTLPIFEHKYLKENDDIVISIKISFKTPTRDSDYYVGVCSGAYCYGIVVTDIKQNPPACPFLAWHSGTTLSRKINAVCSGSSSVTNADYPEELHYRFYPKYGWASYTVGQKGGTSVIGTYQSTPNLAYGLALELYGDDEDNESVSFQYMEIEVKKNY